MRWGKRMLTIVILSVFLFRNCREESSVLVEAGEHSLKLQGPEESGFSCEIEYADICSVELLDELEYGQKIEGFENQDVLCGVWENGSLGRYLLCADRSVGAYITICSGDIDVVFNVESGNASREFYGAFTELLAIKEGTKGAGAK